MKKWVIFLLGVVTGIVITFAAIWVASFDKPVATSTVEEAAEENENLKLFDEPGDVIESSSFKVFQALDKGLALANAKEDKDDDMYLGVTCLLFNKDGKYYYDEEIVKVPQGKVARQIGVFKYESRAEMERTVPVVEIMDK